MTRTARDSAHTRGPFESLGNLEQALQKAENMRVMPGVLTRRLLTSIEAPPSGADQANCEPDSPFRIRGASLFSGNGRAVFTGLLVGALGISIAGYLFSRYHDIPAEIRAATRFLRVRTNILSAPQNPKVPPAPVTIQLNSDLVRVTAIALGHPRLAVINGKEVAEGDEITIHTPTSTVAITLRVIKIGEGKIDLSDGTQLMTARLRLPDLRKPGAR